MRPPSRFSDRSTLDHQFYPHLIDSIFAHAETLSISHLLSLRVSPAWRERVDRRIAYHLVLEGNMVPIEVHSGLLRCRLMTVTAENLAEAKALQPSWARFVRVIDVDATSKHKDLCELLTAWKVERYETLRFTKGAPAFTRHSMLPERPMRVVYLQSPWYLSSIFEDVRKKKRKELLYSPHFMGSAVLKTVLHQTGPTPRIDSQVGHVCSAFTVAMKSLTVFFHEWDEGLAIDDEDVSHALRENLGATWYLLWGRVTMALSACDALMIVGLHNLTPQAIGLEEDLNRRSLVEAFLLQLFAFKFMMGPHGASTEDDGGVYSDDDEDDVDDEESRERFRAELARFKYQTEEGYRTETDPAEYEIETSRVITTMVHDWPYSDKNARAEQAASRAASA